MIENFVFQAVTYFASAKSKYIYVLNLCTTFVNKKIPSVYLYYSYVYSFTYAMFKIFSAEEIVARQNKKKIIGVLELFPYDAFYHKLKKQVLRAYFFDNKIVCQGVDECASILTEAMEGYRKNGKKISLATFHIFSDEFSIIIAGRADNKKTVTIADVKDGNWLTKWGDAVDNKQDQIRESVSLYNPFILNKTDSAMEIKKIIRAVKKEQVNFSLFCDAMPEYTSKFNKEQNYKKVKLFDNFSHLHMGPFSLPKMMKTDILPYYIY
ncbi:hypothetical protein, partial [Photobacterium minamisatsumaniensis]|uniref:hypothetical protein n=1 Tax=Photobacterium minamisatsumaniensis TaxID=2910233 RepID=UPI003D0E7FBD